MKQKTTFKSLLVVVTVLSLSAFWYVNSQSGQGAQKQIANNSVVAAQMEDEDQEESGKIAVPDATVIGRLWNIAQRLIDRKD